MCKLHSSSQVAAAHKNVSAKTTTEGKSERRIHGYCVNPGIAVGLAASAASLILLGAKKDQRFGFPQHSARYPGYEAWVPGFVDYLTFAFTTSSSLGPAEALPLAKPAKLLVTLQVSLSLVILLVLAARAIGLIG